MKKNPIVKRRVGRPSSYNQTMADLIVERLHEVNLFRMCQEFDDLPDRNTIYRWMDAVPEFAASCARAEVRRAQMWATKIERAAEACTEENAHATKVQIAAYQWLAGAEDAKYGNRHQFTGAGGGPIEVTVNRQELIGKLLGTGVERIIDAVVEDDEDE